LPPKIERENCCNLKTLKKKPFAARPAARTKGNWEVHIIKLRYMLE